MQKICVVIPCYNEAKRLSISVFQHYIETQNNLNFCFVNDGSSDNTIDILQEFKSRYPERILIHDQCPNQGKAEAIRTGMIKSLEWQSFELLAYLDADLATPISEIIKMGEIFENRKDIQFVMGSRIRRLGADIQRSTRRHYLGRAFATAASLLLKIGVYDTQCGAKVFVNELIPLLFAEKFLSKWLFDLELIFRLKAIWGIEKSIACMYEMPLSTWHEIKGSKVKIKDFMILPFNLLKIYRFYRKKEKN